jgi:hypothetical protein
MDEILQSTTQKNENKNQTKKTKTIDKNKLP